MSESIVQAECVVPGLIARWKEGEAVATDGIANNEDPSSSSPPTKLPTSSSDKKSAGSAKLAAEANGSDW